MIGILWSIRLRGLYKPRTALSSSSSPPHPSKLHVKHPLLPRSILAEPQAQVETSAAENKQPEMSGNSYIVVFKDGVTSSQITEYIEQVQKSGGELKTRFDEDGGILNGFAAKIPDSFLANLQSLTDVVSYIEPDSTVTIQ